MAGTTINYVIGAGMLDGYLMVSLILGVVASMVVLSTRIHENLCTKFGLVLTVFANFGTAAQLYVGRDTAEAMLASGLVLRIGLGFIMIGIGYSHWIRKHGKGP